MYFVVLFIVLALRIKLMLRGSCRRRGASRNRFCQNVVNKRNMWFTSSTIALKLTPDNKHIENKQPRDGQKGVFSQRKC